MSVVFQLDWQRYNQTPPLAMHDHRVTNATS